MDIREFSKTKREVLVGRAKRMYDAGYTSKEIATALNISEATVRSIKDVIDTAKANGLS